METKEVLHILSFGSNFLIYLRRPEKQPNQIIASHEIVPYAQISVWGKGPNIGPLFGTLLSFKIRKAL